MVGPRLAGAVTVTDPVTVHTRTHAHCAHTHTSHTRTHTYTHTHTHVKHTELTFPCALTPLPNTHAHTCLPCASRAPWWTAGPGAACCRSRSRSRPCPAAAPPPRTGKQAGGGGIGWGVDSHVRARLWWWAGGNVLPTAIRCLILGHQTHQPRRMPACRVAYKPNWVLTGTGPGKPGAWVGCAR